MAIWVQDKSGISLMNICNQKLELKVFVKNYVICTMKASNKGQDMTKPAEGLTVLDQ